MAVFNSVIGSIRARCIQCQGALSSFENVDARGSSLGAISVRNPREQHATEFRLYRCTGCGFGALAQLVVNAGVSQPFPTHATLARFIPESSSSLPLPANVPAGIETEFKEGEACMAASCYRAAAGMFRSVLDKTMKANGYKVGRLSLADQIDAAAADGVITQARKLRAHDDIRSLGNDVLHDDWRPLTLEDVQIAQHYAQRILEDLYDDRSSVLAQLKAAGRSPADANLSAAAAAS